MLNTPKSLRLQIGIFGRTNVGKSSFLNMVAGQDVSITSEIPGTTTDVVEKTMELLPIGPVVFLDTAGINDTLSEIGKLRVKKTEKIFKRADIIILIVTPNEWTNYEDFIINTAKEKNIFYIIVVNKIDQIKPDKDFLEKIKEKTDKILLCSSIDLKKRDVYVSQLKKLIIQACPEDFIITPPIIGDLMPKAGLAVLIVPIDIEAPKGRIILPQVQTIRDILDNNGIAVVVKENEYKNFLKNLKNPPDIVICDSQVVDKMIADTPKNIKCTTFSILFGRLKSDLKTLINGVKAIDKLKNNDKILIAEACSHHAMEDDIGRIKIPKWLKEYTGLDLKFEVCAGRDYPDDIKKYKLIIHCGSCMLTRRETLARLESANEYNVPITNYGLCIAYTKGVLDRVLEPFI